MMADKVSIFPERHPAYVAESCHYSRIECHGQTWPLDCERNTMTMQIFWQDILGIGRKSTKGSVFFAGLSGK